MTKTGLPKQTSSLWRMQVTALALFALLQIVPVENLYAKGGKDGGGGNVCFPENRAPRVLDLVPLQVTNLERAIDKRVQPHRIKDTDAMKVAGVDQVDPAHRELKSALNFLIDRVHSSYYLREALDDLSLFAVGSFPKRVAIGANFNDAKGTCTSANTQAVMIYHWQMGLVIDATQWNKLDAFNQTALLLHEALRNVQIRYAAHFDDLMLQRLTALVMSGQYDAFNKSFDQLSMEGVLPRNEAAKLFCETTSNRQLAELWKMGPEFTATCAYPSSHNLFLMMKQMDQANPDHTLFSEQLNNAYRIASGVHSLRAGPHKRPIDLAAVRRDFASIYRQVTTAK